MPVMAALTEQLSTLERIERDAVETSFREVFATHAGKRVLFWMLEQCKIYRDAYTGEAASTNYVLGQQSAGRMLIGKLDEIDPQFYPQLLLAIAEIRNRERAAAEAMENPETDDDD